MLIAFNVFLLQPENLLYESEAEHSKLKIGNFLQTCFGNQIVRNHPGKKGNKRWRRLAKASLMLGEGDK